MNKYANTALLAPYTEIDQELEKLHDYLPVWVVPAHGGIRVYLFVPDQKILCTRVYKGGGITFPQQKTFFFFFLLLIDEFLL